MDVFPFTLVFLLVYYKKRLEYVLIRENEHSIGVGFAQELTREIGWKIFVNGKPFTDAVTSPLHTEVPLNSHSIITLEYGSPIMPLDTAATYHFPPKLVE